LASVTIVTPTYEYSREGNLYLNVDLAVIRPINIEGSPIPIPTPRAILSDKLIDEAVADVVEFPAGLDPSEPKIDVAREGKDWWLLAKISSQIVLVRL
jgi:hypothetical protein